MRHIASNWADPFRSLLLELPNGTEVKGLDLHDWPPPRNAAGKGRVLLMGDSFHPMSMCMSLSFSPCTFQTRAHHWTQTVVKVPTTPL